MKCYVLLYDMKTSTARHENLFLSHLILLMGIVENIVHIVLTLSILYSSLLSKNILIESESMK